VEAAQSLAAAREILTAAGAWKPTLMIGPPPGADAARNDRVSDLSKAMAKLCAELRVPYFDSLTPLLAASTFIASTKAIDGTHPERSGYAEWARLIDEWPAWREWLP
jgi:acyl-CoA thioesterase-1